MREECPLARDDPVRYVCGNCGFSTVTRTGRCTSCGQWGTLEAVFPEPARNAAGKSASRVEVVSAVSVTPPERLSSGIDELDRVLGGGLVPGGVALIGGQPGIGKSTLLLQVGGLVAARGTPVLYISGEESSAQVALRAKRLGVASKNLFLYCGSDLEDALAALNTDLKTDTSMNMEKTGLFILDSVQAVRAPGEAGWPGTPNQVRAVAQLVVDSARAARIPAVLVGHITKDGRLAGPMLLEHMVDTVLTFSGEGYSSYRMLRAVKNRYGNTEELGVFEMGENGLVAVEDKSGLYWNRSDAAVPGVAMTIALEGSTPLVAEVQTLATPTTFPYPKRTSRGIELNRFQLLAAVLEKRAGILCSAHDLYLNIAGGLSIQDPSADLASCVSLASALRDRPLRGDCCYLGEVGLAGEVRPVTRLGSRLREAERLGLKRAVVSAGERGVPVASGGIEIERVDNLGEALKKGGL
ncbi:MAG: DNA repair protein RadA [Synergistaceae bacterium]|jgi:DNA repair protein RadA/Sms|nr:DNA repair protein RadA [Synergistaceae bacterium]